MNTKESSILFEKAKKVIPGGVNSPVRAFKSVGGQPLFIAKAHGAYLYDADGNKYIDLINSWGPMILGHGVDEIEHAVVAAAKNSLSFGAPSSAEVEMAELICSMIPSVEMVRMVNSGTEATMSAIRLARGYTGRDKIIKFEGCYHGHGDSFLISAGSGAATMGVPDSPGVTKATAADTLTAPYNDLQAVKNLIAENKENIAAIIIEPVAGNMGCVAPAERFLPDLREICDQEGIILIFDEVMTGFRLAAGGVQELTGIKADLTTLGKIIGGGLPVGAYGGKKAIMEHVSPAGPVYQAGTLSGNPVAMAAGLTMLKILKSNPGIYRKLDQISHTICEGIKENIKKLDLQLSLNRVGSMFTLFFTEKEVKNFSDAKRSDINAFGRYFHYMLERGVYLAPSQFEALFVSMSIADQEVEKILRANFESLQLLRNS